MEHLSSKTLKGVSLLSKTLKNRRLFMDQLSCFLSADSFLYNEIFWVLNPTRGSIQSRGDRRTPNLLDENESGC